MAVWYFIYNAWFKNVVAVHKLGLEKNLSRKVDFVLAGSSYSVRNDRKPDPAEYDTFRSNNMKDTAKVHEHVMRQGANRQLFYNALQITLWYKALPSKNRKSELVPRKILARPDQKAKRVRVESCSWRLT